MVIINPKEAVLIGDPIKVTLKTEYTESVFIHLRRYYFDGDIDYSFAEFIPLNGEVDTETSKPVSGSYEDADISGLFWSQKNTSFELDLKIDHLVTLSDVDKGYFILDIIHGERHECHKVQVENVRADVKEQIVDEGHIQGKLYYKEIPGKQGVMIHLAGEPGIENIEVNAKLMASADIMSFALPICGYKNLPKSFVDIPLEIVMDTIDYIKKLDIVDDKKIGLVGSTRGAELALLIGSMRDDIKVIVAANPCDVINQSIDKQLISSKSSWSLKSKPLKFSKVKKTKVLKLYTNRIRNIQTPQVMKEVYEHHNTKALIPVEKISAKLLLLAGNDDLRWDSLMMAKRIKTKVDCDLVVYEHTGQVLGSPGCLSTIGYESLNFPLGGLTSANGKSQYESWKLLIDFIKNSLY